MNNFDIAKLTNTYENNLKNLDKKKDKELLKACKDFEALMLQKLFEEMKKTVPKGGILGNTREEEIYYSMYIEELSKQIAHGKGIGIAEILYEDLKQRINPKPIK